MIASPQFLQWILLIATCKPGGEKKKKYFYSLRGGGKKRKKIREYRLYDGTEMIRAKEGLLRSIMCQEGRGERAQTIGGHEKGKKKRVPTFSGYSMFKVAAAGGKKKTHSLRGKIRSEMLASCRRSGEEKGGPPLFVFTQKKGGNLTFKRGRKRGDLV